MANLLLIVAAGSGGFTAGQLAQINFGAGLTTTEINLGGGYYEVGGLAAVPEPSALCFTVLVRTEP